MSDLVACSFKLGHTKVIGMIVPDVTNQYYPEVMRGVEDEARVHGYQLMLCNSNENPDQEQHLLSMLFSQRVDGVLLASSDSTAVYDRQIRRRFPIVFIDRLPSGCTERAVITNNVQAAYDATRHLISLGHKRIAIIAGKFCCQPAPTALRVIVRRCRKRICRFVKNIIGTVISRSKAASSAVSS